MPLPQSKQELADWMLRRLGAPLVEIEISDEQLEDCIDEAVQFYREYHHDGVERAYRVITVKEVEKYNNRRMADLTAPTTKEKLRTLSAGGSYRPSKGDLIKDADGHIRVWGPTDFLGEFDESIDTVSYSKTPEGLADFDSDTSAGVYWPLRQEVQKDQDIDILENGQLGIRIPEHIIGINKVFRINNFSQAGFFAYDYQFFLNNFDWFYGHGAGSAGITDYYIQRTYVDLIENVFNTQPAIRYNKHKNTLYLDIDWRRQNMHGTVYFMAEVYEVNDPEVHGNVYSDSWLKRYATALAKMQWGTNLKKYEGTELPGGITITGQQMYDEGREDVQTLEEELKTNLQLEPDSILLG